MSHIISVILMFKREKVVIRVVGKEKNLTIFSANTRDLGVKQKIINSKQMD